MQKNGFTKIELLVFLAIFTVVYFVIVNKVSYSFMDDASEQMYATTIEAIEKQAVLYGENDKTIFNEKGSAYITVKDLIDKGYYFGDDEEGNVEDPRDFDNNLNDLKIKIVNKDDKISAKVLG